MNQYGLQTGPETKRRSQRLLLKISVLVQGETPDKSSFREETATLVINAHGALISLATKVPLGQEMLLENQRSHEQQSCKVVYLGPPDNGKIQVGVEFTQPAPHFWHIAFPPADCTPNFPEARARP